MASMTSKQKEAVAYLEKYAAIVGPGGVIDIIHDRQNTEADYGEIAVILSDRLSEVYDLLGPAFDAIEALVIENYSGDCKNCKSKRRLMGSMAPVYCDHKA